MAIAKIRDPVSLAPWIAWIALSVARPEIRGDETRRDLSLKESLIWKVLGDQLNLIEYFTTS